MPCSEPPLIARARLHGTRTALRDGGTSHDYTALLDISGRIAAKLLDGSTGLSGARVAFVAPAGLSYVAVQWAIWRAGGVAVPISSAATESEAAHVLVDARVSILVYEEAPSFQIPELVRAVRFADALNTTPSPLPEVGMEDPAMILYTSGTTNRPKGVVSTHDGIRAQIEALCAAWEWSQEDRIPLFLPLHHIHGIINVLGCALWSGAAVETFARFDPARVLPRVAEDAYTLFMAVPTIYAKLSARLDSDDPDSLSVRAGFGRMRLMVSGSAALPPTLLQKWERLTGQVLLERYGMTETGMILSNPLHGERRCGTVGQPLPGVEVRLRAENGTIIRTTGESGEIQVRGPAVFKEYWHQPEPTAESFEDGWFRTGDLGILDDGYYRILGRLSVDIIKSGGYKLSALEIEAAFLDHPDVQECAVVGLPDETWGETVAIAIVSRQGAPLDLENLREWGKSRLSAYKLPRRVLSVETLPRNAMGKVAKREVTRLFDRSSEPRTSPQATGH